jgi:protein involved in polysaccharide export with SLBB domain
MKKNLILFNILLFLPFSYIYSESFELSDYQNELLDSLPADQRENILQKMTQADQLNKDLEAAFKEFDTTTTRPKETLMSEEEQKEYEKKSRNWVFGYELFTSSPTTFAPATDIPVSDDYMLGPGDEIKFQTYGNTNLEASLFISRNGDIVLPKLGPVSLVGLTFKESKELLENKVRSELIGSEAYVSLGTLRTITIYILGEAYQPGSYKVSSLSTITNALFVSGGVNKMGSVRDIQIRRGGKTHHTFDLYKLLLEGDTSQDIQLQQGDAIFIPLLKKKARVKGSFRRPHLFEILEKDTMQDLIYYAGGLEKEAKLRGKLELTRLNIDGIEVTEFNHSSNKLLNMEVNDGDELSAQFNSTLLGGTVMLQGEFTYPGLYNIRKHEKITDLIRRAGGFTDQAYSYGAFFTRISVAEQQRLSFERSADYIEEAMANTLTSPSLQQASAEAFSALSALIQRLRDLDPPGRQVITADPLKLKTDPKLDFTLQDGDILIIPPRPTQVTVVGEVRNPSSLTFNSDLELEDYLVNVGGLKDSANRGGIFIMLPNGETKVASTLRRGRRSVTIIPGSTIVVPREAKPFEWLYLAATITPILSDVALAAASLSAINKNN